MGPLRQETLSRPGRTQHTRAGAQEQKGLEDREKDSSGILVDKRGHLQASTIINNTKKIRPSGYSIFLRRQLLLCPLREQRAPSFFETTILQRL